MAFEPQDLRPLNARQQTALRGHAGARYLRGIWIPTHGADRALGPRRSDLQLPTGTRGPDLSHQD